VTEYRWQDVRDRACVLFNDTPRDVQEDAVAEAFMKRPKAVIDKIEEIGQAVKNGRISYGWPLMAKLAKGLGEGLAESPLVASDGAEREKRVRLAKIWMMNAGIHFPTEGEIEDELFGDGGSLRQWRDDRELVQEFLTMFTDVARPIGEQLDREELERAERHKESRRKLAAMTPEEKRDLAMEIRAKLDKRSTERPEKPIPTTFDGVVREMD